MSEVVLGGSNTTSMFRWASRTVSGWPGTLCSIRRAFKAKLFCARYC